MYNKIWNQSNNLISSKKTTETKQEVWDIVKWVPLVSSIFQKTKNEKRKNLSGVSISAKCTCDDLRSVQSSVKRTSNGENDGKSHAGETNGCLRIVYI